MSAKQREEGCGKKDARDDDDDGEGAVELQV